MNAIGTATQGMISAVQRFDASAVRTVQGNGDLVSEAVAQTDAKTTFSASAAVLRTADEMTGSLLDILA